MTKITNDLLRKKYGKDIKIYPPIVKNSKDVYILENKSKKFVIIINKKTSISRQFRFLKSNYFQKFLFDEGLNVANVEDIFEMDKKKLAAKHSFINGTKINILDEKTAYKIGKTVANFHIISSKKFTPEYPLKYKILSIADKLKSNLRIYTKFLSESNFRNLPKGICHYDLNLTNFMQTEDKIFLIDFDRWRYWPFACEIARFIRNTPHKQEIINGYQSVRPLTTAEKEYLQKELPELKL